jgi:uncharacterized protein YehS (DUF1456 family)
MINNDILRRLRYALKLNDEKLLEILTSMDAKISQYQLTKYMLKEDDKGFEECPNDIIVAFLDGLIIDFRGLEEGREKPPAWPKDKLLAHNEVLRKIRIALELKEVDIIAMMDAVDFRVSKSELSALFRKEGHRNYKLCGDQFIRNFIAGLVKLKRDPKPSA